MDQHTEELANYIRKNNYNLASIARETGIPYMALYDSLFNSSRSRQLRVSEYFAVCSCLGVSPGQLQERYRGMKEEVITERSGHGSTN